MNEGGDLALDVLRGAARAAWSGHGLLETRKGSCVETDLE